MEQNKSDAKKELLLTIMQHQNTHQGPIVPLKCELWVPIGLEADEVVMLFEMIKSCDVKFRTFKSVEEYLSHTSTPRVLVYACAHSV